MLKPPALLKRRLICMLYEAMLVFGVVFVAGLLLDTVTQSRHALTLRHTRQFWLFIVLGAYFIYSWMRGGQTLAMQTWHIKLEVPGMDSVPLTKAALRYLLAWMWFLPAMALNFALGLKGWDGIGVIAAGMCLWALTAKLNKDEQFLHDKLAGTRLVSLVPNKTAKTTHTK